jgi:Flp pilus assembly pilin Flp
MSSASSKPTRKAANEGEVPQMNQGIARRKVSPEGGQTMAEYAVVLGVISIAVVAAFGVFSNSVAGLLSQVANLF